MMGQETHKGFSSPIAFGSPRAALPRCSEPPRSLPSPRAAARGGTGCAEQRHRRQPSCLQLDFPEQPVTLKVCLQSRVWVQADFAEQGRCKNMTYWLQLAKPEAESHFLPFSPCPGRAAEEEQEDLTASRLCHTVPRASLPPVLPAGFPLAYLVGERPGQGHVGPEVTAAGWLPRASRSLEAGCEAAAVLTPGSQNTGRRVT